VWVTWAIIGITVLVYLLQSASNLLLRADYFAYWGMKINAFILQGQVWRLLTPVLLHGSLLHIGFNMYFLSRIGPGLEKHYGSGRFLALYLATAFTGNVLSYLFTAANSLGASTAIFGLVAAYAMLIYRNRRFFVNPRGALTNIATTILVNLALGLSAGIDNFGHLGGLLGGLAIGWFGGPQLGLKQISDGYHVFDQRPARDFALVVGTVVIVFALLAAGKAILI
jgi:rhomboid protease GluP